MIEPKLEALLKRGIKRDEADELVKAVDQVDIEKDRREAVEAEFESSRRRETELRQNLEQLASIKEKSQRDIRFDQDHFRATLDCALQLNGCEPLKLLGRPSPAEPERFTIPALEEQAGSSWQDLTDTLREKQARGQNIYDWRRTASIRPVVFDDPGKVTNEVVQFHLEHPVVQRLLQRFLSQGFVHDDLSRTCIAHSRDAVKRVALIGRLALYGPEASRLHEEIIFITARWTDSEIREEPLKPYERETEVRTTNLLFDALLEASRRPLPEVVTAQLQRSSPTDVAQLWPHLEARSRQYEVAARTALEKRGDDEAAAMKSILELQKRQIEAQQVKMAQMKLEGMEEEDRRQRDAERKFQDERLRALPVELETEPQRIRNVYSVRASRLEPVGLIYLWPVGA